MAHQHRELYLRLDYAEKLQRYAQFATYKHQALEDGLGKAKGRSKHWERKAKEGTERIASAEEERDEAKAEAQVARQVSAAAGDAKAWAEDELDRV